MPRRGKVSRKKIPADAVYDNAIVQKFINKLIIKGKKSKAENILYSAFDEIKKKLNRDPLEVFLKAMDNLVPMLEVKARRVGGATYQIPVEVSKERGRALAMQWMREVAREKAGKSMVENLSSEIIDASNNTGGAIKKREDLHKAAEANRAFAHFRW